jgi:hypothetical protein
VTDRLTGELLEIANNWRNVLVDDPINARSIISAHFRGG